MTTTRRIEITLGELCWLERRRSGQTADWWAAKHGWSVDEVRMREHDQRDITMSAAQCREALDMVLTPGEYSALARRRDGRDMTTVAARYGVSRMTLWKMEHGKTETSVALARWWRRKGMALPALGCTTITVGVEESVYG